MEEVEAIEKVMRKALKKVEKSRKECEKVINEEIDKTIAILNGKRKEFLSKCEQIEAEKTGALSSQLDGILAFKKQLKAVKHTFFYVFHI